MQIKFNYYPGGKKKALTMSYDDGHIHDRRLVGIFKRYGIRGTFHLNSGLLDREQRLSSAEVRELFLGHEVSAHSLTHPFISQAPCEELAWQILEDRRRLEALAGYPVRGMSYPFSDVDGDILKALPAFGIEYGRTTRPQEGFLPPSDLLLWGPTCHHNDGILERLEAFRHTPDWKQMPLFYVWGHSYEFHQDGNWELIEHFCQAAAGDGDVWYATNIEIVDYLRALRNLKCSVDRMMAYNSSAIAVWVDADGQAVEIRPGQTIRL